MTRIVSVPVRSRRAVTEAFHLGFDAESVEAAVRSELERVRFPERP